MTNVEEERHISRSKKQTSDQRAVIVTIAVLFLLTGLLTILEESLNPDSPAVEVRSSTTDITPSPQTGPSKIEVKDAVGTPQPLDYLLQGSEPQNQQARGGLQKPQRANDLQPNAKTDQVPGDL